MLDQAKLVLDAYRDGAAEMKGSFVIVADGTNSVNVTFVVEHRSN